MLDLNLSAKELQQLAASDSSSWADILGHPNCYPDLANWIKSMAPGITPTEYPKAASDSAEPTEPDVTQQIPPVTDTAPKASPYPTQDAMPVFTAPSYPAAYQTGPIPTTPPKAQKPKKSGKNGVLITLLVVLLLAILVAAGFLVYYLVWGGKATTNSGLATTISEKASFQKAKLPEKTEILDVAALPDGNAVIVDRANQKALVWKDAKVAEGSKYKMQQKAPAGCLVTADETACPQIGRTDKEGKVTTYPTTDWAVAPKGDGKGYGIVSFDSIDPGKAGVTITLPEESDPVPAPALNGSLGGFNDKKICSLNGSHIGCFNWESKEVEEYKFDDAPDFDATLKGVFPLEDGVVVYQADAFNRWIDVIEISDGKAHSKVFDDLHYSVAQNLPEYMGYSADGTTRQVPRSSQGLSTSVLKEALDSNITRLEVIDSQVFGQVGEGAQSWQMFGATTTYETAFPLLVDDSFVVGTYGPAATVGSPNLGAYGLVVFDRATGNEVKRYAFDSPATVWASGGKLYYSFTKDTVGYFGQFGTEEGDAATTTQAPSKSDREAIKEFDFANATWADAWGDSMESESGKWKFTNGKFSKFNTQWVYQKEYTQYLDMNKDGYLDAITFAGSSDTWGNSAYAVGWRWDPIQKKAVSLPVLIGTSSNDGSPEDSLPDAIKAISVEVDNGELYVGIFPNAPTRHRAVLFRDYLIYPEYAASAIPVLRTDAPYPSDLSRRDLRAAPYPDAPRVQLGKINSGVINFVYSVNGYQNFIPFDDSYTGDAQIMTVWAKK